MRGVASNTLKSPFVIKLFMSKCNFYYWPHYQAFQSFEFLKHFDSLKEACIYYVINFCPILPHLSDSMLSIVSWSRNAVYTLVLGGGEKFER